MLRGPPDILTGQKSFFEVDEEVEKEAKKAADKIFRKQAKELGCELQPEYEQVDVNSLESSVNRSLGAEYVCHSIWQDLEMTDFLLKKGISKHVLPLLIALVVGRLVDPGSERHTKEWAEKRSAIYELTGTPLRNSLNSYYRGGDTLYSLKQDIEKHLSARERDLFSLSEKMFFLDLTNTYFEGRALLNPKAQRGRSKDKRGDCKLVTLGLIVDESGFAKYSQLFPGNQSEPKTLQDMIKEMEKNINSAKKDLTIVMDGRNSHKRKYYMAPGEQLSLHCSKPR